MWYTGNSFHFRGGFTQIWWRSFNTALRDSYLYPARHFSVQSSSDVTLQKTFSTSTMWPLICQEGGLSFIISIKCFKIQVAERFKGSKLVLIVNRNSWIRLWNGLGHPALYSTLSFYFQTSLPSLMKCLPKSNIIQSKSWKSSPELFSS